MPIVTVQGTWSFLLDTSLLALVDAYGITYCTDWMTPLTFWYNFLLFFAQVSCLWFYLYVICRLITIH